MKNFTSSNSIDAIVAFAKARTTYGEFLTYFSLLCLNFELAQKNRANSNNVL